MPPPTLRRLGYLEGPSPQVAPMDNPWHLMLCSCGRYFGKKLGQNTNCPMCDSTRSKKVRQYSDSKSLADAVSKANLPEELSKVLREKESEKSHRKTGQSHIVKHNLLISALKKSTDQDGTITMESLERELRSSGSEGTSAEFLIGQAELEGMLIRNGRQSWKWL